MDETPRTHASANPLVLLIGVPLFGFLAFTFYLAYAWRDTTPRGELPNVSDWPEPIQDLYKVLSDQGADTKTFEVFLLHGQPAETLSTVVCRMKIDDDAWKTLQKTLKLQPISESIIYSLRRSIVDLAGPSWWPLSTAQAQYFACERSLAGDEGDLYCAAREPATGRVFIHYEFNF
jgi:hypothetical protein